MNTKDTVIPTLLADELLSDRNIRPLLCIIMEEINNTEHVQQNALSWGNANTQKNGTIEATSIN